MLGREPTLIIQGIVAALTAIQVAAIPLPAWAHTVIGVLVIGLGALVTRSYVSPKAGTPLPRK